MVFTSYSDRGLNTAIKVYVYLGNGLFIRREGHPSKQVSTLTFSSLFPRRAYKTARVTRIDGLPYLCARAGR